MTTHTDREDNDSGVIACTASVYHNPESSTNTIGINAQAMPSSSKSFYPSDIQKAETHDDSQSESARKVSPADSGMYSVQSKESVPGQPDSLWKKTDNSSKEMKFTSDDLHNQDDMTILDLENETKSNKAEFKDDFQNLKIT